MISSLQSPVLREAIGSCRRHFAHCWAFSAGINLLYLALPIYMLQVYDRVLSSGSLPTLVALTAACLVALLTLAALDDVRARVLARASVRLDHRLAHRLLDACMTPSARARKDGRIEPIQDLDLFRQFVSGSGLQVLFDAPWTLVFGLVLFLIHPLLGWIGAGSAVILLAVALIGELGVRRSTAQWNRQAREAHAFLSQASRNTEAAYAMGMIPALAAQWRRYRNAALETQIASAERSADVTSIARFMRLFLQALMLAAGAWLVIERNITPGAMLAATIILGRALQPVEHAVGMWRHAIAAWQALGRVDKLLAEQIVKPTQVTLPRPSGRIQVEQASFFPPGAARPVLRPLNFALEPGQALAIVGPSAAGKSTLARLLMGVYAPSTGSVRLDGAEVHGWDRIDFGRHAGYLPQDVELFAGTVAQNIARYKQTDGDGIVRAAMAAGAHEMILQLPQGYETEIGDGAALLSAGQRQRIALARAVFGAPAMVVLDEPNSSLDSAGDTALANCLAGLKSARTTVVIVTHRAEILRHVDRILCLQDGAQIGFGPRADILPRLYRGAGVAADPGAARIG